MPRDNKIPEEVFIEQTRELLHKARTQSEIALRLAVFGYTPDKINEGMQIYEHAHALINHQNEVTKETHPLYSEYRKIRTELEKLYAHHRHLAVKIFRKSPDVLNQLQLNGALPTTYSEWSISIERFYNDLHANKFLQDRLSKFRFPISELKKGKQLFGLMQTAHCNYQKLNLQNIPIEDNEHLISLEQWMDDFLIAAELALENKPRLLKALGIKQTL